MGKRRLRCAYARTARRGQFVMAKPLTYTPLPIPQDTAQDDLERFSFLTGTQKGLAAAHKSLGSELPSQLGLLNKLNDREVRRGLTPF